MESGSISSGQVLALIFRDIQESPRTLAEIYLNRDRTLVYKWLHDRARPSKLLIPGIVAFVVEKTCEPVRLQLRHDLDTLVSASGLRPEIVDRLLGTPAFESYLEEVLLVSISRSSGDGPSTRPVSWGGRVVSLRELGFGLLAVLGSGILWNGLNRLLGWTYYMGGSGREPRGLAAALWGLTVSLPILGAALAATRGSPWGPSRHVPPQSWIQARPWGGILTLLYTLGGMVGAWAFYSSGLRDFMEGLGLGYRPQEVLAGLAFSLTIPLLPLGVLLGSGAFPGPRLGKALASLLFPALLVLVSVLLTFFIDRPAPEVEQLRGFLAGLFLRSGMYAAARLGLGPVAGQARGMVKG